MDSSAWPQHLDAPSLPSLHSRASTPNEELDVLQDNYYKQFIEGIELEREKAYSPTNLSLVSASSSLSYAQPQGLRDSLFKPIREVLADHPTELHTYKSDTTGENIQSAAMIDALRALQSKIARLEMERAAAAEKFESLASRTSQKQLDLVERPVAVENVLEAPGLQSVTVNGSELRHLSHTRVTQQESACNFEAERRLDSINEKCWQQAQALETTREMLRRAELDRKYTEEQMSRLEHRYEQLRTNSELIRPQFQQETDQLVKIASEEAVRRVEERQREMASSQEQTESRVRELQHELKLERHRRKLLQEKTAELQAREDSNLSLARATSLSSCSHARSRVKRKKPANKLAKHKQASNTRSHASEHYRVQLKDIPFVVGTCTTQSHSVGANYQQLLALLKSHNTAVCGRGQTDGKTSSREQTTRAVPVHDSRLLIEELERELATLQISHQHLARELQLSQDSPSKDSEPIELALRQLLDQMDVKAQHVRLAKTVDRQVRSKPKGLAQTKAPLPHRDTPVPSNSPPVNLYSNAPLPASNITALRAMRNIQNTLKVEDLHWN